MLARPGRAWNRARFPSSEGAFVPIPSAPPELKQWDQCQALPGLANIGHSFGAKSILNGRVLPEGFYAVPFRDSDGPVEIDVAAVGQFDGKAMSGDSQGSQLWAPPEPRSVVAVEWDTGDSARVEILSDDGDPPLAAAIELVSPGNKDRPKTREAFAAKCADYLRRGCGLVVVDTVTTHRADLSADLWAVLGIGGKLDNAGSLSAVSYRSTGRNGEGRLLAWPSPLVVGQPLPTLPLWLGAEIAVPLDLELSHTAACDDLRIRA